MRVFLATAVAATLAKDQSSLLQATQAAQAKHAVGTSEVAGAVAQTEKSFQVTLQKVINGEVRVDALPAASALEDILSTVTLVEADVTASHGLAQSRIVRVNAAVAACNTGKDDSFKAVYCKKTEAGFVGGDAGHWSSLDEAKEGCDADPDCEGIYNHQGNPEFYKGGIAFNKPLGKEPGTAWVAWLKPGTGHCVAYCEKAGMAFHGGDEGHWFGLDEAKQGCAADPDCEGVYNHVSDKNKFYKGGVAFNKRLDTNPGNSDYDAWLKPGTAHCAVNTGVVGKVHAVNNHRAAHKTCRGREKEAEDEKHRTCSIRDSKAAAVKGVIPAAACGGDASAATVNQLLIDLADLVSTHQTDLSNKVATCNTDTSTYDEKAAQCDLAQSSFESAFCSYHAELTSVCSSLDTCYSRAFSEAEEEHAATKTEEEHFTALWTSAKKIRCFVKLLKTAQAGGGVTASDVEGCVSATHGTSDLGINYGSIVSKAACDLTPVAKKPGDAAWAEGEYPRSAFAQPQYMKSVTPCA